MYRQSEAHAVGRFHQLYSAWRVLSFTLAVSVCVVGESVEPIAWHTGTAYKRALSEPMRVYWPSSPIRAALTRLSRQERVAVFLDRRVDPDMMVDYQPRDVAPMADLLQDFAAKQSLGVASIGSVVYIGPAETAAKLPTLLAMRRQELGKLPPGAAGRMAGSNTLQWEMLTTPDELFNRIEKEFGIQIEARELAPHDLWPAANLPSMSFSECMTLLLAGFDLTYEFADNGNAIQLRRIPQKMTLTQTQSGKVTRRTITTGDKRFTLKVENQPVGPLVKALAARLELDVEFDAATENQLDEMVSLNVKEVTRDELIRAALDSAGLDFRIEGKSLIVFRSP